jgi:hypothetical protein
VSSVENLNQAVGGYVLSNESGHKYVFPDVAVDPGFTVIVSNRPGMDGVESTGQVVVHWPMPESVWDLREDTALLTDPSGTLVVSSITGERE